jgi:hypothetical protein
MKRYILFISFWLFTIASSFGQHNHLVFSGAVTGTVTWNSYDTIYITGNVTIASGNKLTIAPNTAGSNAGNDDGVYVVFTGQYSIELSGSGAIDINGTSGDNIYFTADRAEASLPYGDKTFGESGETWRALTFNTTTGTSVIDHAVFEYGTGSRFSEGGGIDAYGRNITIRNTEVRNCSTSGPGGGIYVYTTSGTGNITLQNLSLHNNTAGTNGGGLYVRGATTSVFEDCEIYSNSASTGYGVYLNAAVTISNFSIHNNSGDGVRCTSTASLRNCLIYSNTTGIYFTAAGSLVNSDVVNNTTGINSTSGTAPVILNAVIWGNGTQLSGSPITVAYCGVQGGYSGTGNIDLNSNNGDPAGPNFVNPPSDLHIGLYISPLVDGGTDSYTGVTIPAADMDGHSRLGTIDIGAYEFFYYNWTGTVSESWTESGNWEGSPSTVPTTIVGNRVVIPGGCNYYPTVSDITLSSGSRLEIAPQAGLTVTGATTVNSGCTFLLGSDATGSANFITGSSVSGSFTVEMFLLGGGDPNYNWHFISTPVNGIGKAALTTEIGNTYNLMNYDETVVTGDMNEGWNWHDTFEGRTSGFSTLYNSLGYTVYVSSDQTATFTGTILGGQNFTYTNSMLTCGTGDISQRGWNLIGNPFTAGVDLEYIVYGTNVNPTAYFTQGNSYLNYNSFTHEGTTGNLITGLQGFFVHATEGADKTLTIPASSRYVSTSTRYKGDKPTHEYPILKFNVSDGSAFTDIALIYFFKDATTSFDGNYDAFKLLAKNPEIPQIYTVENNIKLSMNGLPYPDQKEVVPLKIRIGKAQNYTFNILNLENLADYIVTLVHGDKKIDLKSNPAYTFYATTGTISDMSIVFENISTDVNLPTDEQTVCWYSNGSIMIKTGLTGFEDNSSVAIYDMNGRVVYNKNSVNIVRGEIFETPVDLARGIYIITVSNNGLRITKKIVITY